MSAPLHLTRRFAGAGIVGIPGEDAIESAPGLRQQASRLVALRPVPDRSHLKGRLADLDDQRGELSQRVLGFLDRRRPRVRLAGPALQMLAARVGDLESPGPLGLDRADEPLVLEL